MSAARKARLDTPYINSRIGAGSLTRWVGRPWGVKRKATALSSRLADLGDDFVPVGDEDADSAFDLPQIRAQVVLQILDANPLDRFHVHIVATSSYHVKPAGFRTNSRR